MTEKHFIISLCEDLIVKGMSGTINRNSNSTQFLDVELDEWKLNEGEELYIELSHYDGNTELTTNVGPLHLIFNETLGRYVTLAPPELVCVAGQWNFSIELRSNIGENGNGDLTYNSLTSAIYSLTVINSIISASATNNFSKEAELLSATKLLTDSILVGYTAEEVIKQAENAKQSEESAAQSAEVATAAQAAAENAQISAAQSAAAAAGSAFKAEELAVAAQASAEFSAKCAEGAAVSSEVAQASAQSAMQSANISAENAANARESYEQAQVNADAAADSAKASEDWARRARRA